MGITSIDTTQRNPSVLAWPACRGVPQQPRSCLAVSARVPSVPAGAEHTGNWNTERNSGKSSRSTHGSTTAAMSPPGALRTVTLSVLMKI